MINQNVIVSDFIGTQKPNINPDEDILIIPYFVSLGGKIFIKDQNTFRRIFDGMDNLLLRPYPKNNRVNVVKETPNNEDLKQATYLTRTYHPENLMKVYGQLTNNNYSTSFDDNTITSGLEQGVITTHSFIITSSFLWDYSTQTVNKAHMYSFFRVPELSDTDVFYISNAQIFLSPDGAYHHTEVSLQSCNDVLRQTGRSVENFFSYSEPGMKELFFEVEKSYKEVNSGKYEVNPDGSIDKSKPLKIWKDKKTIKLNQTRFKNRPITSIQIEFSNMAAMSSMMVIGRPIKKDREDVIYQPTFIMFKQLLPLITSIVSPLLSAPDDVYNFIRTARFSSEGWKDDWRDEVGAYSSILKERKYRGMLVMEKAGVETINYKSTTGLKEEFASILTNSSFNIENMPTSGYMAPYSTQKLTNKRKYTIKTDGSKLYQPTENITQYTTSGPVNVCRFLNFNHFSNLAGLSELVPDFMRFVDYQGIAEKGASLFSTIAGAIAGGKGLGKVGALGGGFGGSFIGDMIGYFIPKAWLIEEKQYYSQGANNFSLLIPKRFYEVAEDFIKTPGGLSKNVVRLPLEVFEPNNENTFAGVLNISDYNTRFRFELSDLLDNNNSTLNIKNGDHPINDFDDVVVKTKPGDTLGYAIDVLQFQCIGGTTATITFYDEDDNEVHQITTNTHAVWSDNSRKWTTTIRFSDWDGQYPNQMDAWNKSPALKLAPEILTIEENVSNQVKQALQGKITPLKVNEKVFNSFNEWDTWNQNGFWDWTKRELIKLLNDNTITLTYKNNPNFNKNVLLRQGSSYTNFTIRLTKQGVWVEKTIRQYFRNTTDKGWGVFDKQYNQMWNRSSRNTDIKELWTRETNTKTFQSTITDLPLKNNELPANTKLYFNFGNLFYRIRGERSFKVSYRRGGFDKDFDYSYTRATGGKWYDDDLSSEGVEFLYLPTNRGESKYTIVKEVLGLSNLEDKKAVLVGLQIDENNRNFNFHIDWNNTVNEWRYKTILSGTERGGTCRIWSFATVTGKFYNFDESNVDHFVNDFDYDWRMYYRFKPQDKNLKSIVIEYYFKLVVKNQIILNNDTFKIPTKQSDIPNWSAPQSNMVNYISELSNFKLLKVEAK